MKLAHWVKKEVEQLPAEFTGQIVVNGAQAESYSGCCWHWSAWWARRSLRLALDDQAERMLGPVALPIAPLCPVVATPETQRTEWPG